MARRFITRTDIDAAVTAGETVLRVGRRDTVTDVAREHAQQRGVRIERTDDGGGGGRETGAGARGAGGVGGAGGSAGRPAAGSGSDAAGGPAAGSGSDAAGGAAAGSGSDAAGGPAAGKQTETTSDRASTEPGATSPRDAERLRRQVRRAVVAELGTAPAGLDDAIARVLNAQPPPGSSS